MSKNMREARNSIQLGYKFLTVYCEETDDSMDFNNGMDDGANAGKVSRL